MRISDWSSDVCSSDLLGCCRLSNRERRRWSEQAEMPVGDILPEITLILTATIILLVASFTSQERHWLGAPLALIGLTIAGVMCARQLGRADLTFSGVWALDGASTWARLLILAATALDRKSTRLTSSH